MSHEEFLTSDLQLASYLASLGHQPLRVEGYERRTFVFRGIPSEDVNAYHLGTRPVAPLRLFTQYRALKRMLYQPAQQQGTHKEGLHDEHDNTQTPV